MRKLSIVSFAAFLVGCQSGFYGTYPETRISYVQDGKNCVYTEEYGEWTYGIDVEKSPENEYFVISNKRQVIFENTDCSKVIDSHLKKEKDVYNDYNLKRPVKIERLI